jgi:hypothetical protein
MDEGNQHFFYTYTSDELMEVLRKPDEWSSFDFKLAKTILKERGVEISNEALSYMNEERRAELSQPDELPRFYLTATYIFALIGGVLGFLMAIALFLAKKSDKDKNKIYRYSDADRIHGRNAMLISIACMMIWSMLYSYRNVILG